MWLRLSLAFIMSASLAGAARAQWDQTFMMLASDGAGYDYFGSSVSISGDTAVIGAVDLDFYFFAGKAYVFETVGGVWTQQAKLIASPGQADDWFGRSVSISGGIAIVGAPGDSDLGTNAGSVYAFQADTSCVADLIADGQLDFFDVQQFLNYYAAGDLRADFIADGQLDFYDVQRYLNLYSAGCP